MARLVAGARVAVPAGRNLCVAAHRDESGRAALVGASRRNSRVPSWKAVQVS
ncbi:MAG: hypothetical protein ACRDK3_17175 [Actinomycetota bacterium]